MKYRNISNSDITIQGVNVKAGEVKEIIGNVNDVRFVLVADDEPEKPIQDAPVSETVEKRGRKKHTITDEILSQEVED